MRVELLGELTPDKSFEDWLVSEEVQVNYFPDTPLRFVLHGYERDKAPTEFVAAIKNFMGLTLEDRAKATPWVYKNYTDFVEAIGEDDLGFVIDAPDDVWKHIRPSEIHVERRSHGDAKVYVSITGNCDWEEEHGLQIVYREGKQLSRVSDQDGHLTNSDAYDLPEGEDSIS